MFLKVFKSIFFYMSNSSVVLFWYFRMRVSEQVADIVAVMIVVPNVGFPIDREMALTCLS